jgi:hypothetical protein
VDLACSACSFVRSNKQLPVGAWARDEKEHATIQPRLHHFSWFQVLWKESRRHGYFLRPVYRRSCVGLES